MTCRGWLAVVLVLLCGAGPPRGEPDAREQVALIHASVQVLTDVMVHDIFSPPQASRAYAYPLVAYYEALRHQDPTYRSYAGQLNGLTDVPSPDPDLPCHWLLAGTHAFMQVAEQMVFSEDRLRAGRDEVMARFAAYEIPEAVYQRSLAYGEAVAAHILAWAAADGYAATRALPRYTVAADDPAAWEPTPPAYIDAIEPHWSKLRPFVLDAADQFLTERPNPFDMTEGAPFYEEVMAVYEAGVQLTDEQREIAAFWDCNPFVVRRQGHLSFGLKKITPGGHWMGITGIAIEQYGDAPVAALATYSLVALGVADAFIVAWDEKYRSNRIRPETVIRKYVDPDWQPVLQTPPFPEYTSAHSTISRAAALLLTHRYGEAFAYRDDVEEAWGLPPRHFNSFVEAAEEAALSRLYGGIHYRPSIRNGIEQGRQVGTFIAQKVTLHEEP